ncbi:nuclear transport factor 2 family protein [Ramlibacter sp. AW1]|uniref:Nuclear transport factor 2 family protein n=1 Tax=Ramlibacter aurantiacus TaxID=2801330 RepID=A0A937D051_9BURK|nr:nuclear transport factor 2 family protein [Ramlibacter aurantiacus]MBL0419044.1 nuclear transport factor 2 family protein [Ramlibacter aurantiacus]
MTSSSRLSLVQHLLAEYTHCIDDERYEEWPDFFTDPCVYRVTTRESVRQGHMAGIIDCESRGMLVDRINSLRRANIYEPQVYRHLLGPTRLTEDHREIIKARTGFALMRVVQGQGPETFLTGYYDDIFACGPRDEIRIRERLVVLDSTRIDTLLVIPV